MGFLFLIKCDNSCSKHAADKAKFWSCLLVTFHQPSTNCAKLVGGLLWQTALCWWLPINFCHMRCITEMTVTGLSTPFDVVPQWLARSSSATLPPSYSCSIFFGSVPCRQTWPNHDSWRRWLNRLWFTPIMLLANLSRLSLHFISPCFFNPPRPSCCP